MKALMILDQERFKKHDPHTAFSDSVTKIFLSRSDLEGEIPPEAKDADFIAVDPIVPLSREWIAQMPNLKIIHSEGVGFDKIDVNAARERHVVVCNNRGVNAAAVAEQAVLLMLGALRSVITGDAAVRGGRQIEAKERMILAGIRELGDCKVGLVGFGAIAKETARRLAPFGCEVFYYDAVRSGPEVEAQYGARWLPLNELRETCDIISLHVPVTPETTGMIDAAFLKGMKRDAILVNTARGEIVDNEALVEALCRGWIAGAALDTVAPEPVPADHPLLKLPDGARERLLFSPHVGGVTHGVFTRAHKNIWKAFETVAKGGTPENVVS